MDDFTFSCNCFDGSFVQYRIENWTKMVYQSFEDWTKRKAEYERGKWINL